LGINAGGIVARIAAASFDATPQMRQELHDALLDRMQGIQRLSRKPF